MAELESRVTVTDVRIPFWRLVVFFLKLALAVILAAILFALIVAVVVGLLRAIGIGMMMWQYTI